MSSDNVASDVHGGAGAGPVRDLTGYADSVPVVRWPGRARIAISLVINIEEGSEVAIGNGDDANETGLAEVPAVYSHSGQRDLAIESMYEYGSRAGYFRLAAVADEFQVPVTAFACAVALENNPAIARSIVDRGFDVVSHGYRWEDVTLLSRDEERDHIRLALASFDRTLRVRPEGWYCRYGPSVHTRELLVEEGFRYDCDSYADDLPYFVDVKDTRHLVIPYSLNNNDGKFSSGEFGSPREFFEHLQYEFDMLYAEGAAAPRMMSVGLHLRLAGHPARTKALRDFIRYATSFPDVWFATRAQIAAAWTEQFG
jgi:peptidoglycan/xylan/chitin deacetylase (PgdA/CDA1 family)